jgi:putative transposase
MRRRHELTDEQWYLIKELLPGRSGTRGRVANNRQFVNAVLFVARTGIPWRDLPRRFGNWNSVWRRYDRWCKSGVWERLTTPLGEPDLAELYLDSTSIRAHQAASGSQRQKAEKKVRPTSAVVLDGRAVAGRPNCTQQSTGAAYRFISS